MKHFLLLILCFSCSFAQAQSVPSLAQISVELDQGQSLPLAQKVRFELSVMNPDATAMALKGWGNITVESVASDSLAVSMVARPRFLGSVLERYSKSSFVIDIEEEGIKQFVLGFEGSVKPLRELSELEEYVSVYINKPTYVHGFKIASVVADQRSGDCTEYAVLLTALARSLGLPSRVVLGTVLLEQEGAVSAFGHAWSEVWLNGRWQIADAALYGSKAVQHFYLPSGALENEGPGFGLSLFEVAGLLPLKITKLKSF